MITPMTKYTFLCHQNDFKPFLEQVQEFGLLDVQQRSCELDGNEKRYLQWIGVCSRAIQNLQSLKQKYSCPLHSVTDHRKSFYILKEYFALETKRKELESLLVQLNKTYHEFRPWGNYDPANFDRLKKQGIHFEFYICDISAFDPAWQNDYVIEEIYRNKRSVYFAAVYQNDQTLPPFNAQEVVLPALSLTDQLSRIKKVELEIDDIDKHFEEMIVYLPTFKLEQVRLMNALEQDRATMSTESLLEDQVIKLTGYLPTEDNARFETSLKDLPVYFISAPAQEFDDVPIKLKNGKFSKLFELITNVFSLPSYTELDLTPFLAPFFMIFVGFCMGDAGYGLLLILLGFLLKPRLNPAIRPILSLAQWFGLAGMVFGAITGTFFGIELVKIEALGRFRSMILNQNDLMMLSLGLGGIQIIYGMGINIANIIRRQGFKYAVGRIGWLIILLSSLVAFGLPELDIILPLSLTYACYGFIGLGGLAAFFYNSPGKNTFLQFGMGFWDAYNMVTGLLGDLLSYIRLFALGLTGGILGSVFNTMAFDMAPDNVVFGPIVTLLILVFGHSLNIGLTLLGSVVHPLRLTFVEFYKNAGFVGGGRAYKPFIKHNV